MKKYMDKPISVTNDMIEKFDKFIEKMILDSTGIGDTEPDFDKLDEIELCALLMDYSDYVQEMYKKNQKPDTAFEFFDRWCGITKGPLCHTFIGTTVFIHGTNNTWIPKVIKQIIVNEDYSVSAVFEDGSDMGSGCVYIKPKAYEL